MSSGFSLNRGRGVLLFWRFALAGLVAAPLGAQTLRIYHIDVEQGGAYRVVYAFDGRDLLISVTQPG